jgi:hypothetical protein
LYQEFRKHYLPKNKVSIPELIIQLKTLNNDLDQKPVEDIIGPYRTTDEKYTNYKRAKKIGFFLNLKPYPPSKWIKVLNNN